MKMTHPESDHPITVADDSAPMYESQGWTEADEPKSAKGK